MIRIVIADDHAVVRQGLRMILSEQSDMKIVGEAKNTLEALDLLQDRASDILILDLSMPGRSGLDFLSDVHAKYPRLKVLVLSMLPEELFAKRVLKSGASGYLSKGSPPLDLIHAIRKIHNGGRYISPSLAEILASDLGAESEAPPHERLSDREFQVLLRIASGQPLTAIADDLSLSTKTVTTYRARILQKMHLRSNADLTRYVLEHHLAG